MDGYTVAGKTGTAKKLVNGSYLGHSDYNVSFVGFVPSRAPRFTIVVVVDSPHKVSPYGGVVAAPIFQRISEAMMQYAGVPRTINPEPPVVVARDEAPAPDRAAQGEHHRHHRAWRRRHDGRHRPGSHRHERARRGPRAGRTSD